MKNLTPELIAKAKTAKSAEELLELAKANGVELTEAEAKTYFEQINANGAVADDDLGAVAGGSDCPGSEEEEEEVTLIATGTRVTMVDGRVCPKCKCPNGKIAHQSLGGLQFFVVCDHCGTTILNIGQYSPEKVQVI